MGTRKFDIREVEKHLLALQDAIERYREYSESLNASFESFVVNDTYLGKGADAAKLYMSEVEMGMLEDILEVHQLLFDMHVHMYDSFKSTVDSAPDARIDVDVIKTVSGDFYQFSQDFEHSAHRIETKASSVEAKFGHLADFTVPKSLDTMQAFDDVIGGSGFLEKCIDKFKSFDENEVNYAKSQNFDDRVKEIENRISRTNLALEKMEVFKPSFGIYEIFLAACNSAKVATAKYMKYLKGMHTYLLGSVKSSSICKYDPVNLCNGNYINERVDINLGGRYRLEFKRFYNAVSEKTGPLGRGWTHSFEVRVNETGDDENIQVVHGDGSEGSFVKRGDYYLEEHGEPGILEKLALNAGYTIRQDDGRYEKFDKDGKLIALGDVHGEHTCLYYAEDRLIKVVARNGNSLAFSYYEDDDNTGLIKSVTDHAGRSVSYTYENKELVEVCDSLGAIRKYVYSQDGRISNVINPKGITAISNEYDDQGRIRHQSFPDSSEMTYEYDDDKREVTATEQNGNRVVYTHDELERHTGTRYYDGEEKFTYNLRNQKISATDKRGHTTHFAYDRRGHLTKVVDALGNKTSITYNANGKPMAVKGPKGEEYRYSYDALGRLYQYSNPLGETNRFYYSDRNISSIKASNGAETNYEYDERGNVTKVTDPDGVATSYEYDELNRVTATISADGMRTTFEYDNADRIIRTTDALGLTKEYAYDSTGKVIWEKETDGSEKKYDIDVMGRVYKITDEEGRVTEIAYNSMGKQEEVTLPNGGKIHYEYDPLMRLSKITDPEGRSAGYTYDPNGNVLTEDIGDIRVKNYEYDALNHVIKETDAQGNVTSFEYDEHGQVTAVIDALGNRASRDYDLLGRLIKETDALGNETSYSYTKLGDIESITDPAGRVRKFEYTLGGKLKAISFCGIKEQELFYDNAGRVSKRLFADGYTIIYTYDVLGRIAMVEATDGRKISYEYDSLSRVTKLVDGISTTLYTYTRTGRLKSVVDAMGNETAYTYDSLDNLQSIHRVEGLISDDEREGKSFPTVGKDGHVTLYSYNLAGQLTKMTDALGQVETYEYDQYGRIKAKTDRDKYTTSYEHDNLGNVVRVGYSDGKEVAFSYDALGKLVEINDWLGKTRIQNDALGRAIKVSDYLNREVSYEYGKTGEKTKLVYPDGREAVYTYDDRNFLSSISANGNDTKYTYDTIGRLTSKAFPNGVTQAYSYLPGGYLESMVSSDKKGRLDKYLYSYDGGQISKINRERRDLNAVSGQYEYQYDSLGRLISSSLNGKPRSSYTYDAFGNRKSLSDGISRTDYSYDDLDRLTSSIVRDSSNNETSNIYSYDRRGNQVALTSGDIIKKTFKYDAMGKMTHATDTEKGDISYTYNGLGFRVESQRPEEKIEYLCDLSKDYYNLLERTVNGETESFIYDNNVVSMNRGGNNYYYLQDELGSTMYLTGTDGLTVDAYAYDDFGRRVDPYTGKLRNRLGKDNKPHACTKNGNIIQPFAFTGYQEDEVSELNFAQARYYNPETGRFNAEDWVRGYKHRPDTINHYAYCLNSPSNRVDVNGKESYYIFYSETDFSAQAMSKYWELVSSGVDPNDIKMVGFDENDTHKDFIEEWNNMTDEHIEEVSVFMHSNSTTLIMPNAKYGINNTGVSSAGNTIGSFDQLSSKDIGTINLVSCNSGLVTQENNIASQLLETQNVDKVLCWNGSVAFDVGIGIYVLPYFPYSAIYYIRYTPRVSNDQHGKTGNFGQVCYYIKDGVMYYYYVDDPDTIYEFKEVCNG